MHIPDQFILALLETHKNVRMEESFQSDVQLQGTKVEAKKALKWLFADDVQRKRIHKQATELVVTYNYKFKGSNKEVYIVGFYLY